MKQVSFLFLLISLSGCIKFNNPDIDPGLLPYYNAFIDEANARNIPITDDHYDIRLVFTDIPNSNVLGLCDPDDIERNVVQIDRFYWATFDEPMKEFVIFHELGHCILDRNHTDATDSSGNCLSIMHSSVGICKFEYEGTKRVEYIDELFNF